MTTVARAADAVAAAVRALPRARDDDDDERADDEVRRIRLEAPALDRLARRFPLTPVYREFLASLSSHDFVAAGLRCGARPTSIVAAPLVEELTDLQAPSRGWGPRWLVCALAEDGCYALELDAPRGVDCPVLFVPSAEEGKVEQAAPGFVAFLEQVARDSRPGGAERAERAERPVHEDRRPEAPGGRAAAPAADGRRGLVIPVVLAALALLLWWLRA